jgi:hypothetical protein
VWQEIGIVAVLGFVRLWLARQTGFPEMWDRGVSNTQRFLMPTIAGLIAGTILVIFNQRVLQLPAGLHVAFPASILYYLYASIESEFIFCLVPIPLFVWLISSVLLRHRSQVTLFWGVAILISLREPLLQLGALTQLGLMDELEPITVGLLVTLIYGTNLTLALATCQFQK